MSDVFVSYKAEDRPRVGPLVDALKSDGLSVWWDAHLSGGDKWRETIARELDNARCVIVVWSKRSTGNEGHFVRDEATRALRRGAYLAVRIDKVEPPLGFGESQAASLIGWKGDRADPRYGEILGAARQMVGMAPQTTAQRAPARRIDRRTMLAGGAVLVAVAAGSGLYTSKDDGAASDSIAVLPFANLSGDPDQAYFSDGMAEEVRSALSRVAQLKVVARTSSEMMRNTDIKTAARKLDVANILTGSVRRSASTIRVSAQLINGKNGLELWSQSFDRPVGDVLQIQSGIAASVAEALSVRLGKVGRAALSMGGTSDANAQDLLHQAMRLRAVDSESAKLKENALLDAAIVRDPHFAEAYARKAFTLMEYAGNFAHNNADVQARQSEGIAAARRAVSIEPRLALGYAALGAIYAAQLDIGGALAEFDRASAQPGADVLVLGPYSDLLGQIGRSDEALRMVNKASQLDPLDPLPIEIHLKILFQAHRFAQAVIYARQALDIAPGMVAIRGMLANSLFMLRRFADAAREYSLLPEKDMRRLTGEAFLAARQGDRRVADHFRNIIELRYGDAAHYQYAQIAAQLGDRDLAFAELEQAWNARDGGLSSIRIDPFIAPLQSDPRFAAVVRRLNFP